MYIAPNKRLAGPMTTLAFMSAAGATLGSLLFNICSAETECKLESGTPISCVADVTGIVLSSLFIVAEGFLTAAVTTTPAITPRATSDNGLVLTDSIATDPAHLERDWIMHLLENEGEKHSIVANTSRTGVQVITDLWLEGHLRKATTHLQHANTKLARR